MSYINELMLTLSLRTASVIHQRANATSAAASVIHHGANANARSAAASVIHHGANANAKWLVLYMTTLMLTLGG